MEEFWNAVLAFLAEFASGTGRSIAWAIAILAVGLLAVVVITKAVKKTSTKSRKIDNSAASFVTSVVSLVAYVGLFMIISATLGFSTESLIAAFSSVMLAIALGLQNTLASLANGILLIFTKPIQAGDYVDIAGVSGTVKEIKLFSVKIVTIDNLTIVIPNNTVFGSTIVNYSKMPLRRMDIDIHLNYSVDIERVKGLVLDYLAKDERILKDPAPFFRLMEYERTALRFTLRAWTQTAIYWDVRWDVLEGVVTMLKENGIEIAINQMDVNVRERKEA